MSTLEFYQLRPSHRNQPLSGSRAEDFFVSQEERPNQRYAEQGFYHLNLAVLDALTQRQPLNATEIRLLSGIDNCLGNIPRWGQFMGTILRQMENEGIIEQCQEPGRRRKQWRTVRR